MTELEAVSWAGFSSIALVKEVESPENPGALEKRVALIPDDVAKLVEAGITMQVEAGAGDGVGFSDLEYINSGASIQTADQIYRNKDLIIKFKGPSMASILQMKPGTTLFCMAHFHSYPERAELLQERQINVIAMEEICESPKQQSDQDIISRVAMATALQPFFNNNSIGGLRVRIIQWSERLRGAIRRCGNRDPRSVKILQPSLNLSELEARGADTLYFYDSSSFNDPQNVLAQLQADGSHLFDLYQFEKTKGQQVAKAYRQSHPPVEFGMRKIQCLHETGMAGARYGVQLLRENKPDKLLADVKAVVLGYGNVAQGAIDELHSQGMKKIHVLGRTHTSKGRIDRWLKNVDLVVNGAEQAAHLRGVNFLISNQHLLELIPSKSVVIDLVGGSPSNRSPVEAVMSCSFLTEPVFKQNQVSISSLWGWPMMGMMRETAIRYSGQITDVLIGKEKLIDGLAQLTPGVKRALVCGPF